MIGCASSVTVAIGVSSSLLEISTSPVSASSRSGEYATSMSTKAAGSSLLGAPVMIVKEVPSVMDRSLIVSVSVPTFCIVKLLTAVSPWLTASHKQLGLQLQLPHSVTHYCSDCSMQKFVVTPVIQSD